MKCSCGNNRFYASQVCYHNVITDEFGSYAEDVNVSDAENPNGPFYCTECGKEYEDFQDSATAAMNLE